MLKWEKSFANGARTSREFCECKRRQYRQRQVNKVGKTRYTYIALRNVWMVAIRTHREVIELLRSVPVADMM